LQKIIRSKIPDFLKQNWKKWTKQYMSLIKENPQAKFQWYQYKSQNINKLLIQPLKDMTNNHCSFCDGYPMGNMSQDTIEHFRPKEKYPKLSFCWSNLFLACNVCQEKFNNYSKLLLKPDSLNYEFNKYFIVDYKTGKIKANPVSSKIDQDKAEETIKLYKLNDKDRPNTRLKEYEQGLILLDTGNYNKDDFSYRFMYE
jgi:uncharacterized protein (TIGR02646 family)